MNNFEPWKPYNFFTGELWIPNFWVKDKDITERSDELTQVILDMMGNEW